MRKIAICFFVLFATAVTADASKAWLGMGLVLKNSPDGSKFLYVVAVPADTPAAKAGMMTGDVVTAIDKKPITFRDDLDLMEFTAALEPNQVVRFLVTRSGAARTISVKAGVLPREYEERSRESMERARAARKSHSAN